MHKMYIRFNEEKLSTFNYNINDANTYVRNVCEEYGVLPLDDYEYVGDFASVGSAMYAFIKMEWFVESVKEWYWMSNEETDNKNIFDKEDLIEGLRKYEKEYNICHREVKE